MITYYGRIDIPFVVVAAADEIKLLNYKTTTPAKFRKNQLTEDIAGEFMSMVAERINVAQHRLDYVYFSVCKGAEPHVDELDPMYFTSTTFVIPVILPRGRSFIEAGTSRKAVELGGIYEFNHEEQHSMTLEDTESGCVVIMIAVKH